MFLSAGYSNVAYLKSRLMPEAATDDSEHDADLAALGKGVAGKFDRFCGRGITRQDAVDQFSARASAWVLTRYPVEEIETVQLRNPDSSLVEIETDEWTIWENSGLLETQTIPSRERRAQLVVTYTGGYWLNPRDGTAKPSEANELPDELLEAWVLQCQHEAESRGIFGAKTFRKQKEESAPRTATTGLLDGVSEVLNSYRRFGGE